MSPVTRQATAKKSLLWDKVVPYTFAANVNAANRALVKDSLKSLNAGLANCLEIRFGAGCVASDNFFDLY